jgi:hypothetical protein
MKWMKQVFAQRYNREDGRTGHIWGDRYGSRVLEGEPPGEEGVVGDEGRGASNLGASNPGVRPYSTKVRFCSLRVRPYGGERAGKTAFPLTSPCPAAPAPG